jgi:multiple sugar transport system permease protein
MAGSVIALIPVLLLFIFNQRYFVEGIKLSGMKG